MNKILFSSIFFLIGSVELFGSDDLSRILEQSEFESAQHSETSEHIQNAINKISKGVCYFGTGAALGSASLLARLGWAFSLATPLPSTITREFHLLSYLFGSAAQRALTQAFKGSPESRSFAFFDHVTPSQSSWHFNQKLLSHIPTRSDEDKQLLLFLERRWLAKCTGFFPTLVDWVCPCFEVSVQVHPETCGGIYARNPSNELSETYKSRIEAWKQFLPHPHDFPLILTRPFDLQCYLPSYLDVPQDEKINVTVERAALKIKTKVVLDLTRVLPQDAKNQESWLQAWGTYRDQFSQVCKERGLNLDQIVCIQRIQQKEIGGIRLLPFSNTPEQKIEQDHQFILEWISHLGLAANRIELDRLFFPNSEESHSTRNASTISMKLQSKEELYSILNAFDQNWNSIHPQKTLMFKGTIQMLKGLLDNLTEEKWNEITNNTTRSAIAQLSFLKINEQLKLLSQEEDKLSFFDSTSHLELIHADLSCLLEVFSPFTSEDFPSIYRNALTFVPVALKPFISCAVHSSGMTSVAGIFKAMEKAAQGKPIHVIYGENTYFECIKVADLISQATSIEEATDEDWRQVDLILAQFNPALKRIELQPTEYKVEKIADALHKSLKVREGKPLTLALDCTIDFINSSRVDQLLDEFQKEIEEGILNIICYRSGLKFDLFGMDNYCGAPLYMIHNQGSQWKPFDFLLSDPALQTDRLSLNWFCLAYKSAALQLDLYRKQIFDNTWALLKKVPSRLFSGSSLYRIVPFKQGADLAFVDIKISGPFHQLRGAALAGGCLFMGCMEKGHPIFYRPSLGFYHPNFTMIFGEENSTIRLTLGLDPAQVDVLAETFKQIDMLNGSSQHLVLDKWLHHFHIPALSCLSSR